MARFLILALFAVAVSCKSDKRYHDQMSSSSDKDTLETTKIYPEEIGRLRAEKDQKFADPEASPLTAGDREGFTGLSYFETDPGYRVEARFEPTPASPLISMPTTTDREVKQRVYGVLYFTMNGRELKLNVYQDPVLNADPAYSDYLFLPFTDLTNGEQTYGGGRYLDLSMPDGDRMVLDFNKAYNPYCAYNVKFSCPLVPRENHLEVAVEAGEKAFAPAGK